ncbi:MAG: hypothetical protein JJ896_14955 [Rhodothermales bacterium]|nr:hypothetical protein [Rhodothermales bacterium]MBO6780951.1 hypothetical protein [Rhodothermales bacterium]
MRRLFLLLVPTVFVFAACDPGTDLGEDPEESTWDVIQARILQPKCAEACHAAGTTHAEASGLVLTADVAYEQLVGEPPTNSAARNAGLLRVHSSPSTDLYQSYLWVKINAPEQDRLYKDTPEFGSLMPLGTPPLTYGELNYIRRWLLAGAPKDGVVADEIVLTDTATYRQQHYEPLPELAFEEGISLRLEPFEVAPNFEREFFVRDPYTLDQDRLIKRSTMSMRPGSHHFIAYTFSDRTPANRLPLKGQVRDLRQPNGALNGGVFQQMQYHEFFSGTQWPRMDYRFPDGVALHVHEGTTFDMNSHYVNLTSEPAIGEVQVNLEFAQPGEVQHVAHVLNLNNTEFELPARKVTTVSRTFRANERLNVFTLFSHAHKHMIEFRVEISGGARDGEMVYLATDYEHPPILEISPPLVIEEGQGLRLVTTYNNWTDETKRFGFLSTDEMMILFGYYYTDAGKGWEPGPGGPFTPVSGMATSR